MKSWRHAKAVFASGLLIFFLTALPALAAEGLRTVTGYIVPGGDGATFRVKVETLEGRPHDGRRMVMFEFPSMDAVHAFWNSPDYVPIKKLREGAAVLDIWAVEGV